MATGTIQASGVINNNPTLSFGSTSTIGTVNGTNLTVKMPTVSNSAPTLSWGTTSTVGTIDGTALTVKMPSNPNTTPTVSNTTSGGVYYYKYGNVVYIQFYGAVGSTISSGGTLATIPSGYRPVRTAVVVGYSGTTPYFFHLNTSGTITTQQRAIAAGTTIGFSTCYTTA